jgi:hypothetical protein
MRGFYMHENTGLQLVEEISAVPVKEGVWWVGQERPVANNPEMYAAKGWTYLN